MEIRTQAAEGGTVGGAGPHGLKVLSWLGFPGSLHPDFSLFASRITASGFYHAPLTPASSVKSFKSDRNWGVPRHLAARVCLLPSPSLPEGLFSPRQRLLSGRGRHSPRQAAAHSPSPRGNTHGVTKARSHVFLGPPLVISFPLPTPLLYPHPQERKGS